MKYLKNRGTLSDGRLMSDLPITIGVFLFMLIYNCIGFLLSPQKHYGEKDNKNNNQQYL